MADASFAPVTYGSFVVLPPLRSCAAPTPDMLCI
jgi:hypothetical protein